MPTSNDPTLVVSSKPYHSAQTSKTSEHIYIPYIYNIYIYHMSCTPADKVLNGRTRALIKSR